jgi:hypothetical protein
MGSKRLATSMYLFPLLAAMMLMAACVGVPTEQTEPETGTPALLSEPGLVDQPAVEDAAVVPQTATEPVAVPAEDPVAGPEPAPEQPIVVFDPSTVSAEVKELTFADVKRLIQNLNTVIQTRNYDLWITNLTEDYVAYWSDPEILARLSESPVLRRQNITLANLRDYFIHVVYPSRQNDRVDDIEFIGETRIKAIIVNPKGERLVLYNLEKIGDTWKIANWR